MTPRRPMRRARDQRFDQPQAGVAQHARNQGQRRRQPPKSIVASPLTKASDISAHASGLSNTEIGVIRWKRAITSGSVSSHMVRLIKNMPR